MDRVKQIMERFRANPSPVSRLDALVDVERLSDPRVVPFLLEVLTDAQQAVEVRVQALKRVRDGSSVDINGFREPIASALLRAIQDDRHPDFRLHAVLALGEFTDVELVPHALAGLALDPDIPLDVRYSAFTSLERAGPTPESIELVRQLLPDDALGMCARSLLSSWRV